MNRHDCRPTLTDGEVLEFCADGFAMYESVVPSAINRRVLDFCDTHGGEVPATEDWYIENVLLNDQIAGAVRSLLGANFEFKHCKNHRAECPSLVTGGWHRDGGSVYSIELDCLQVFYYPQDTPMELGPTEVVPGSHFFYAIPKDMGHYGAVRGRVSTAAPAGSIFITMYPIWHRRGQSTATGTRNLIKFWYRRTVAPTRDWVAEPEFAMPGTYAVDHALEYGRDKHRTRNDAAEMFYWLSGKHGEYFGSTRNLPIYYPW